MAARELNGLLDGLDLTMIVTGDVHPEAVLSTFVRLTNYSKTKQSQRGDLVYRSVEPVVKSLVP